MYSLVRQSASLKTFTRRFSPAPLLAVRASSTTPDLFTPTDQFLERHVGSTGAVKQQMLNTLGYPSLDKLLDATVPSSIRLNKPVSLDEPLSETQALQKLRGILSKNVVNKSFIGVGFYETVTPGVILRNVRRFLCSS